MSDIKIGGVYLHGDVAVRVVSEWDHSSFGGGHGWTVQRIDAPFVNEGHYPVRSEALREPPATTIDWTKIKDSSELAGDLATLRARLAEAERKCEEMTKRTKALEAVATCADIYRAAVLSRIPQQAIEAEFQLRIALNRLNAPDSDSPNIPNTIGRLLTASDAGRGDT